MKLTYEREADAAYVTLVEALVARTEQVDRGMLVDVDEQGRAIGIEVIRPTRRLPLEEIAERYHLASAGACQPLRGRLSRESLNRGRHLLWSVDPRDRRQRRRHGLLADEALGMLEVGRGEHPGAL